MIGDDGQRFERGPREGTRFLLLPAQQETQVLGRAKGPSIPTAHQVDAPIGILCSQHFEQAGNVGFLAEIGCHFGHPQRFGRCEQQRLENAQMPAQDLATLIVGKHGHP
ncbi:hypothetical protein D3C87_1488390 [compost metagenome]